MNRKVTHFFIVHFPHKFGPIYSPLFTCGKADRSSRDEFFLSSKKMPKKLQNSPNL